MLSDGKLRAILDREIDNALGYLSGDLTSNRWEAMDYYLGEAEGDLAPPEVEGRSEVVSTDVADVIEWILPQVIKTFVSADDAVVFDPQGPEDEQQAEQETDYCNYVFYKDNEGFLTLYTWFKDAMMLKTGTTKVYWDESEEVTTEEYTNLTEMELGDLLSDEELEIEQSAEDVVLDPSGNPIPVFHVELKRTRKSGVVTVDCIPPEEFLVNADHTSISVKDARFVAHERVMTASELVEMGIEPSVVRELPEYDQDHDEDNRNTLAEENEQDDTVDPALRKIRLYHCFPLIDYDEDGIAERREILYVKGGKILVNESATEVPFACLTPYIMPHRWAGLSIFDRLKEIQKQKTAIWRQILDNMYLTNNQRTAVQEGRVNLDDLLQNRPGGLVRVKGSPADSMMPITQPPIGADAYNMLEYMDKVRTERSGTGPDVVSQTFSVANETAHGLERLMTMKEELVNMITRVFGETGVKTMFRLIHSLSIRNQDKEKVVKLRNEWVPVNPSEWLERTNMTIKVGLGTGDRLRQQSAAQAIVAQHNQMIQEPGQLLVTPNQRYKALVDLAELSGMKNGDQYYLDPNSQDGQMVAQNAQQQQAQQQQQQQIMFQMQQQLQQALAQAEQMKAENGRLKVQADARKDQAKAQIDWLNIQLQQAKEMADKVGEDEQLRFQYEKLYQDISTKITELEMEFARDLSQQQSMNYAGLA